MTSEQLARSLLPPASVSTRRSPARPVPSVDWFDRVLLASAALLSLVALWALCSLATMGL